MSKKRLFSQPFSTMIANLAGAVFKIADTFGAFHIAKNNHVILSITSVKLYFTNSRFSRFLSLFFVILRLFCYNFCDILRLRNQSQQIYLQLLPRTTKICNNGTFLTFLKASKTHKPANKEKNKHFYRFYRFV